MQKLAASITFVHRLLAHTDQLGAGLAPLVLRLLLALEFGAAGWEKWQGENWFADITERFPFPFNILPVELSWQLATVFELLGAVALVLGFGVRFTSISLLMLTFVAVWAVHMPEQGWASLTEFAAGYAISDQGFGNYKLPLIYAVMFLPLLLQGPGTWSVDAYIRRKITTKFLPQG